MRNKKSIREGQTKGHKKQPKGEGRENPGQNLMNECLPIAYWICFVDLLKLIVGALALVTFS